MSCTRFTSFIRPLILGGAVLTCLSSSARAAVITGATATASTTLLGSANAAVNGAGLSGGLHDNVAGDMWLSQTVNSSGGDPNPFLRIDLGAVYDITSFSDWNYNLNQSHTKGIQNLDILYSATNPAGTDNLLGSYTFTPSNGDGINPIPASDTFSATFTARYVYLDINTSWDATFGDPNTGYGLSEIQFTGTPAVVPEPSSVVLMVLGGVITVWFCKKRRSA